MEILYLLIPLSLVLVFLIAAIFWWSLRSGQFEDLEGPGYRIVMDDDSVGNRHDDRSHDDASDQGVGATGQKDV
ncbi:MAG: cbb3-type cytochrome oxidase assembly protein CcoS [Rhodocyclaceae bacterium]|jgi:cbb3-type cytochrome oxidase maturation protein|nr:cbb3-type cytochrome oxidase assembly protein CcoS [Rhodocyclaceae bacterium]